MYLNTKYKLFLSGESVIPAEEIHLSIGVEEPVGYDISGGAFEVGDVSTENYFVRII